MTPDIHVEDSERKLDEGTPAVMALRLVEYLMNEAREDQTLKPYVEVDQRMVPLMEDGFSKDPRDPDALKWLWQLAGTWSIKMRGANSSKIRRLFSLLDILPRPTG
jgi:hypothetical protein